MEKKKLLFVMYQLSIGGAEKSLINLLNEIDYSKFEIDLLVFDYYGKSTKNGLLNEVNEKVNIITPDDDIVFVTKNSFKYLFNNFSLKRFFYLTISKLLKFFGKKQYIRNQKRWKYSYSKLIKKLDKQYDCAISYMHSFPNYYVIDKVQAEKKYLWVHNDYSSLTKKYNFDKGYFEKANKIVTISDCCVNELKNAFPEFESKILCLPNYSPVETIKEKGKQYYPSEYEKGKLSILSIGRLTYQKGFDVSIKAAKELKSKGINFKWIIIGSGKLKVELENLISDDIKNDVFLVGLKKNPYPYFLNCDIFVQTSRFEGKSIVIDEAKIFEKPIICTNYNTVSDQIIDGENGIIVPLEDSSSVCDAIINIIKDEKLKNKLINGTKKEKVITIKDYEKLFLS